MKILLIISVSLLLIGYFGIIINTTLNLPTNKFIYHIYSYVSFYIGFILFLIFLALSLNNN